MNAIKFILRHKPKFFCKHISEYFLFRLKYGFSPPPAHTDLTGYERIIDFISERNLVEIPGDIIKIGSFLGGGTYKLCKFCEKEAPQKTIYTQGQKTIYIVKK